MTMAMVIRVVSYCIVSTAVCGAEDQRFLLLTQHAIGTKTITETFFIEGGIRIETNGRTLGDILEDIERASGIIFKISPKTGQKQIKEIIVSPDWTTAVRKLLRNYSRVEILKSDGTLQRVLILNTGGSVYAEPSTPPRAASGM